MTARMTRSIQRLWFGWKFERHFPGSIWRDLLASRVARSFAYNEAVYDPWYMSVCLAEA